MFFPKALMGLALAAVVSTGSAQIITQDVGIERYFGSEQFKAKNGGAQLSLMAVVYYWNTNPDISFIKKAKTDATVSFYISSDDQVSGDDRLVYQKAANGIKVIKSKIIKLKTTLTQEDKGKYLLGVVTSPASEIPENDVTVFQIPPDAY